MKRRRLEHRFVRLVPKELEPGVLYVSIEFATAVHSCCCGCGEEVVTPFTPNDWRMTFDGETISLWPSIGNWDYPCRSHYVVSRNLVVEARPWSDDEIAVGRRKDKAVKERFYHLHGDDDGGASPALQTSGVLSRITRWFTGRNE